MNKMLVAVFDNETAADSGLRALRKLHADGEITLYAAAVMVKDAKGVVTVRKAVDDDSGGMLTGMAVGSLIGLLGGPMGVAIGAATGSVAGAVREFWGAGVGLDFIETSDRHLQAGKSAVVAEIEEEWVLPVDAALESAGGRVFRRSRTEVAEAQVDSDIVAFKAEIRDLESEASRASGTLRTQVQDRIAAAKGNLDLALGRGRQVAETLKREVDWKAESLRVQLGQVNADMRDRIETRVNQVKRAYHSRGAKLSQAWSLTKEALAV